MKNLCLKENPKPLQTSDLQRRMHMTVVEAMRIFFVYSLFLINKFLKAGINRMTSNNADKIPPCSHSVE